MASLSFGWLWFSSQMRRWNLIERKWKSLLNMIYFITQCSVPMWMGIWAWYAFYLNNKFMLDMILRKMLKIIEIHSKFMSFMPWKSLTHKWSLASSAIGSLVSQNTRKILFSRTRFHCFVFYSRCDQKKLRIKSQMKRKKEAKKIEISFLYNFIQRNITNHSNKNEFNKGFSFFGSTERWKKKKKRRKGETKWFMLQF